MDSFDTQIQCEEVYGDDACAQFMMEQMEQMEIEDVNAELRMLGREETPEFLAYVALVQADEAAGRR